MTLAEAKRILIAQIEEIIADMPKPDPNACWLCHGEKRVEWDGVDGEDDDGNPIMVRGVYGPCPECEEQAKGTPTA